MKLPKGGNTESVESPRTEETGAAWAITPLHGLTYAGDPQYAAKFFKAQRWHYEDLGVGVKQICPHCKTRL